MQKIDGVLLLNEVMGLDMGVAVIDHAFDAKQISSLVVAYLLVLIQQLLAAKIGFLNETFLV